MRSTRNWLPLLASLSLAMIASSLFGEEFTIPDPPPGSIFDSSNKVVGSVKFFDWLLKVGAAFFAISAFISAGNYAKQGHYGRAVGAVVGGIIAAIGSYLVVKTVGN